MRKKSIRLLISTLLLSLTVLVGGCGTSNSARQNSTTEYSQNSTRVEEPIVQNPTTESSPNSTKVEEPIVQNSTTKSSRFSSEYVEVSGVTKGSPYYEDYDFFDNSYIITDNKTGQQWLYLYHDNGYDGGSVMVELDTIETSSNMEK